MEALQTFAEHTHHYIGGQWVAAASSEVTTVINPATEEAIATVPNATAEEVDLAVRVAAAAFPSWRQSSVEERAAVLERLGALIEARSEEITRTIVSEVGQPFAEAAQRQVATPIRDIAAIAAGVREVTWSEPMGSGVVVREPAGVVGAIAPWNAPLKTVAIKACAAIAAGCTVVLKSSEVAPLSAYIFAELFTEAGLPAGVFNLVTGTGIGAGEAIAGHPAIDMVSLTGSVGAGQRVMEVGAKTIKRVALELGGKSANVILSGADLQRAVVDGIDDAFRNAGQVCGGLTRVLVPRDRLAEAEELAVAKAEGYVLGDPFDPATTLGPVISDRQRERIRGFIKVGVDEGARLLAGGAEQPEGIERGYFVRPTVFAGDNTMRVAREEIFGPVVCLIPYADEAEALAMANDSDYGLAGGVWAGDPEHARAFAAGLRVGRVRINGAPIDPRMPHGGFKRSGIGREWGRVGVEDFLEYKSIIG